MSTRTRALILPLIMSLIFVIIHLVDMSFIKSEEIIKQLIRSVVPSIVMFIGFYWVVNFNIKASRILTILTFPFILIFIASFFSELVLFGVFEGIGRLTFLLIYAVVLWVLGYITVLTANILNVSLDARIPLGQAGRAAQYVLTLIASYLGFSILFSLGIPMFIKLPIVFIFTSYLSYIAFWTLQLTRNELFLSSLIIGLLVLFASIILSFWPLSVGYVALILSTLLYMTLGIGLEIRETVKFFLWVEYGFLFIVIILIAFLFASFGINGSLI